MAETDVTARRTWASLVFVAAFTASGCGIPEDERVASEFTARHPGSSVVFVAVGEGDGSNAYFHIGYTKPGDARAFEQVWLYQDLGRKEWECTWRSPEALYRKEDK
jgi:hypothetical protein